MHADAKSLAFLISLMEQSGCCPSRLCFTDEAKVQRWLQQATQFSYVISL